MNSSHGRKILFSKGNSTSIITLILSLTITTLLIQNVQAILLYGIIEERNMQLSSACWTLQWLIISGLIYRYTVIEHLPFIGFDHARILIDTNTRKFHKFNNFRFKAKWLLEENFLDLVKSVWSIFIKGLYEFELIRKTNLLKKEIKNMAFTE